MELYRDIGAMDVCSCLQLGFCSDSKQFHAEVQREAAFEYLQILKNQKRIYKTFREITTSPQQIYFISDNDFKLHLYILLIAFKRQRGLEARILNHQNIEQSKYEIDISEKAAIKAFFKNLDIEELLTIYKKENKRRKMDESFSVPDVDVNFTD
ncbi:Hypothetical_protein [Hexamita inflata]|uniref:Hypothetical_protein n=1 Tax=Hexamita inflata TaxID=28002 RepID=A0AA86P940_9EUKA|nr:Hypothetical protein HINF_LOCUS22071 [Hexamita inflata]